MSNFSDNMQDVKRFLKKMSSKLIKKIVIIVAPFVAIIILLGGAYDALMEGYSEKVSDYVVNNAVIPTPYGDGSFSIPPETIEGLKKVLEESGIELEKLNIKDEHIEKMYAAELVSQTINTAMQGEVEGKYYGRVYLSKLTGTNTTQPMTYIPSLNDLKAKIADQSLSLDEVSKLYTVEGDTLWLVNITEVKDGNGTVISREAATTPINYKDQISQYTMPFEFLADLAAITRNIEFVMQIANKVINETYIQMVVMQTEIVTENKVTYTWTDVHEEYTQTETKTTDPNTGQVTITQGEKMGGEPVEVERSSVETQITTTIESRIGVMLAKTWIINKGQGYDRITGEKQETTIPDTDPSNIIEPSEVPEIQREQTNDAVQGVGTNSRTTNYRYTRDYKKDEKKSVYIGVQTTTCEPSGEVTEEDKSQEIVDLINTPYEVPGEGKLSARGNLESGFEIFANMLKKSSRTEKLEKIMRYIMFVLTGDRSYGVTSLDFSIFAPNTFSIYSSGIIGNTLEDKLWFSLRNMGYSEYAVAGLMGNLKYESGGFNPSAIEGGTGEGIGLAQW